MAVSRLDLAQRVLWVDVLAFLPALALATHWYGAEGLSLVVALALPLAASRLRPVAAKAAGRVDADCSHPGRAAIVAGLDRALAGMAPGEGTACLVICLDDPEDILRNHGRDRLDRMLGKMTERLQSLLRDHDVLARLDGFRFAVVLAPQHRCDLESCIQIAARLQAVASDGYSIDAAVLRASASVGFCHSQRGPGQDGAACLAAAEVATEEAWRNGPGAIRAYSPEVAASRRARDQLRETVTEALDSGQIVAFFQPQVSTDTGEVVGFEALARWQHPDRGLIAPAEFLPAIHAAGLSTRLSEVMIFQALSALRAWDRLGLGVPSVAVNLSQEELSDPLMPERLKWEIDRFDLTADRLCIEVLETVVSQSPDDVVVHGVTALTRLGCTIDLDDFGTGNATISAIRRFGARRIKIDRSFVRGVDVDPAQQQMVAAILSLAERLELATIGEGVETPGEHAMLAQLGCTHVQGYAIARPMPFDETAGWIRRHRGAVAVVPRPGRRAG